MCYVPLLQRAGKLPRSASSHFIIHNWISRNLTWPAFFTFMRDIFQYPPAKSHSWPPIPLQYSKESFHCLKWCCQPCRKRAFDWEAEIFMNNICVARIPDGINTWFQKCRQGLIRLALDVTEYGSPIFHPETVQGIWSLEGWEEFQSLHVVICHNDEKHNINWVWWWQWRWRWWWRWWLWWWCRWWWWLWWRQRRFTLVWQEWVRGRRKSHLGWSASGNPGCSDHHHYDHNHDDDHH